LGFPALWAKACGHGTARREMARRRPRIAS